MRGLCSIAAALLAASLALSTTPSRAQSDEIGQRLAERLCARCHAVRSDDESAARTAPPFRELGLEPLDMLQDARTSGIIAGHDEMPMFELSKPEIDGLITYMRSVARTPRN